MGSPFNAPSLSHTSLRLCSVEFATALWRGRCRWGYLTATYWRDATAPHTVPLVTQNYGAWLSQWIDDADQAKNGGVVRRNRHDVDNHTSIEDVVDIARKRQWHVIETGDQVIVLCNEGDIRVHC